MPTSDDDASAFVEKVFSLVLPGQISDEELEKRKAAVLARLTGPEAEERSKIAWEGRKEKERFRLAGIEDRKREWREDHSYRWMLNPVPYFDEETEETAWMPLTEDASVVESIRECAQEYDAGDKKQWQKGFFFERLCHLELDWESIIRRETNLWWEFVHGRVFEGKDEPYNVW